MRFLLIDHFDSFTYNIKSWFEGNQLDSIELDIRPYGFEGPLDSYELVILSPGPKSPSDYPLSLKLLLTNTKTPVLGICLGMQMMVEIQGGKVSPYSPPLHGKTSPLTLKIPGPLFKDIEQIQVARYHSLVTSKLSSNFSILATSPESYPMAIYDVQKKWLGLQFHPESFLTEQADLLRQNIIQWVKTCHNKP